MAGMVVPGVAAAQPPSNDDVDNAVVVTGLPFNTTLSTAEATAAADDPTSCTNNGSVWFSFTPDSNVTVEADTFGSDYDTVLSAYTGSPGAFSQVPGACNDDADGLQSRIFFTATAGTTYHFLVGQCCGTGGSGGGNLTFSVAAIQTAANDNFADATAIPGLPFTQTVDNSGAALEAAEPGNTCAPADRTLWYSFTPNVTASVTARTSADFIPVLTVFTGSSLTNLTEVDCNSFDGPLTFRAIAGQTYHLQLGDTFGTGPGRVRLSLDVAPAVAAEFFFSPSDPSAFDTVSFFDSSFDPGGSPIQTRDWQFGDGTFGTGCCPNHHYAVDGDYPVGFTVTTTDGRTGSTSRVVAVRTHDVAIDRFQVPQSARAGQTRAITVQVKNTRYDETVRVELHKSTSSGFVQVGTLTQFVAVHPTHTVEFPFNYTFTSEDAALGKVTFRAVAVIDARDALPSDNQIISPPTTVN